MRVRAQQQLYAWWAGHRTGKGRGLDRGCGAQIGLVAVTVRAAERTGAVGLVGAERRRGGG